MSKQYDIDLVTSNVITLSSAYGNVTSLFNTPLGYPDVEFDIRGSTGSPTNNGRYKVLSAAFISSKTEITIVGTIPNISPTTLGQVTNTTSYVFHGTDWSNAFFLHPTQSNNYVNTSLKFSGRNNANWGEDIQQNLLYLLDNFSNTTEPPNKVRGQIWFDKNINKLKVYDGSTWLVLTSSVAPSTKYTHTQGSASATWNINHSLGTTDLVYSVYVQVGPNMVPIIPNDIAFVDANNITITFSMAYAGKAVLIAG